MTIATDKEGAVRFLNEYNAEAVAVYLALLVLLCDQWLHVLRQTRLTNALKVIPKAFVKGLAVVGLGRLDRFCRGIATL
jgi:hypothetical protein